MRLTILPTDISCFQEKSSKKKFTVSCRLPWTILKATSSPDPEQALLAIWYSTKRECEERGIDLIWRATNRRIIRIHAEIFKVLYDDLKKPLFADLVVMEKKSEKNIRKMNALTPYKGIPQTLENYQRSSFAIHLPYKELPQPKERAYHKGLPETGDRYMLEIMVDFGICSACHGYMTQGRPILKINGNNVQSTWFMHYLPAAYTGQPVNENEIMESLEKLDMGNEINVEKLALPSVSHGDHLLLAKNK